MMKKENLHLEFKEAKNALPKSFFETVCAFLNTEGGQIILGIADDGTTTGIAEEAIEKIKIEISNLSNNPSKLESPYLLFPHEEKVNDKWIIKTQVPVSSQVHRTGGQVYLRSTEGDYRISDPHQIAGLVNRKLSFFSEQQVFPYLEMGDLRADLFDKARQLMLQRQPQHPWAKLSNDDLLNIAGFVRKDIFTGKIGYTLATALMFGTDEIIHSVAAGYKFDALLRKHDTDRYDDRLIVRTNLIDAFDLLMGFIDKHLDNPFYQEGTLSISLRDHIFRELVANIIAHREYSSSAPATIIIYENYVEFKNPNVPHGSGPIDPLHFTPYPKNPTICKFMIQMGRYDELGSGIHKVTKYLPFYSPSAGKPSFVEGHMFTTSVPLRSALTPQVSEQVSEQDEQVSEQELRVLNYCNMARSKQEILKYLGLASVYLNYKRHILPLLSKSYLELTIPDKPNSRLQKYRLTEKGKKRVQ